MNDLKVSTDWFVRECIEQTLSEQIDNIVKYIMQNDIDYSDDEAGLVDALMEFLDLSTVTEDEFRYIVDNVQICASLEELVKSGYVQKTDDGRYKTP